MQRRWARSTGMVMAAAAVGVAGCGSSSGGNGNAAGGADSQDTEAITRVIKDAVVSSDVEVQCVKTITKDFLQRVYGDIAQCRKAEQPDKTDKKPTDARTSAVKVNGQLATARVKFIGGDADGTEGGLELRKQDGQWRVDDLGVDLLRSQVQESLNNGSAQDAEALRSPAVRDCTKKAFDALADDELKRIAYLAIAERKESDGELAKVILPCLSKKGSGSGPGDASFLREKFEMGIEQSARKDGVPQASIDCILKELRSTISDGDIAGAASGQTTPKLKSKVAAAVQGCNGAAPATS